MSMPRTYDADLENGQERQGRASEMPPCSAPCQPPLTLAIEANNLNKGQGGTQADEEVMVPKLRVGSSYLVNEIYSSY